MPMAEEKKSKKSYADGQTGPVPMGLFCADDSRWRRRSAYADSAFFSLLGKGPMPTAPTFGHRHRPGRRHLPVLM